MFSLMFASSFVSELTLEIAKPMSEFQCQQSSRTLATKVVLGLLLLCAGACTGSCSL